MKISITREAIDRRTEEVRKAFAREVIESIDKQWDKEHWGDYAIVLEKVVKIIQSLAGLESEA